jgi:Lrp/AsnC family leucine-responsive transcriptional regulator
MNEEEDAEERRSFLIGTGKRYNASKQDIDIVNIMTPDARISMSELSKKTGIPKNTIQYRINKMKKEGFFQGYNPIINLEKLGYKYYKVDFCLSSLEKIEELEKRLAQEKGLLTFVKTAENADIIITIYCRSIYELNELVKNVINEFPDISTYKVNTILKIFKGLPFFL